MGTAELAKALGVPAPSLRRTLSTKKVSPSLRRRLDGLIAERQVKALTAKHVQAGIAALSKFDGFGPGQDNEQSRRRYETFREHKRAIYALYPDNKPKAQAIVRFIMARAGWAPS